MTADLHDPGAERSCVGWMLARPNHWHLVTEIVTVVDFADPAARSAFAALSTGGYQTVQALACGDPTYLDARTLKGWAEAARDHLVEAEAKACALVVVNLSLRRRIEADALATVADTRDWAVDEVDLVARVKERAERAEAPDAPPGDPAQPVDRFMAEVDDAYDWVIDGMIERRDRMLVTAHGGVGKSTLLRQFAVATAAGCHPFTGLPLVNGPQRVLLLDLENSPRQVRRKLRPTLEHAGEFDPDRLRVIAKPQVMDVTTPAGWRWLAGQAALARPDVIIGGPIYRLYEGGDASKDMGGRDKARQVVTVLDRLRDRFNCALILEAHPPKGSMTLSPHGSAVWEWWPEFGVGLMPETVGDANVVEFHHWRYPRDDRDFPSMLARSSRGRWTEVFRA